MKAINPSMKSSGELGSHQILSGFYCEDFLLMSAFFHMLKSIKISFSDLTLNFWIKNSSEIIRKLKES